MKNNKSESVLRDIGYYFQFAFEKGYELRYIKELYMEDWEVCLESPDNLIIIGNEQGKISLLFSPLSFEIIRENMFSIEAVIYFLSKEQKFIGKFEGKLFHQGRKAQLNRLSGLLEDYIDQITPYFGSDFENYKEGLKSTRNKYFNLYLDKYISKR